jgi:hypothetical protein
MLEGTQETQTLDPSHIAELDSDFAKAEVKMNNNEASGYDRIPADFWKILCNYG